MREVEEGQDTLVLNGYVREDGRHLHALEVLAWVWLQMHSDQCVFWTADQDRAT
jgi:hypothetical protein